MKNKISNHAAKRYQERFNMNHKQREVDFRNAIKYGKHFSSISNKKEKELREFIESRSHEKGIHVCYYLDRIYVYQKTCSRNILITVFERNDGDNE